MLTEDLLQSLQSLIVNVEHTINRVPFDDFGFPKPNDEVNSSHATNDTIVNSRKENPSKAARNGSPKCGLKRREIITKHKPIQNRYTLRRMSNKADPSKGNTNTSYSKSYNAATEATAEAASATSSGAAATSNDESNTMPLFCLGGSFPHIDSDEDSGDDGTKSANQRKSIHSIQIC